MSFQILSNDDKAATGISSIGNDRLCCLVYPDRSEYNFRPYVNRDNMHTLALLPGTLAKDHLYSYASSVTTSRATQIGRAGNGSVFGALFYLAAP
jgi:hypothetical protein